MIKKISILAVALVAAIAMTCITFGESTTTWLIKTGDSKAYVADNNTYNSSNHSGGVIYAKASKQHYGLFAISAVDQKGKIFANEWYVKGSGNVVTCWALHTVYATGTKGIKNSSSTKAGSYYYTISSDEGSSYIGEGEDAKVWINSFYVRVTY